MAVVFVMATSLCGCAATKLLSGDDGGSDQSALPDTKIGGGAITLSGPAATAKAGGTALSIKSKQTFDQLPCAENPTADDCNGRTTGKYSGNKVVVAQRPTVVTASVSENADKSKASVTVDGAAFIADVPAAENGQDSVTKLVESDYESSEETENGTSVKESGRGVEIKRVAGVDSFFFFEAGKGSADVTNNKGKSDRENVWGVGGTLAAADKVKTATYKGKAAGIVEAGDESEGKFLGDSEITANLTTKKLDAKLTATNGVVDQNNGGINGVGSVVRLSGADIVGNTFGGGKVSLSKADGAVLGTFAEGDATSAGGFYGENAQHVAGVLFGVGEINLDDGTKKSLFLASDFWGTEVTEPTAAAK
jgi:C-lobe and N-lobe beta barrels of Tf-binding protein B